ncbi:MAG TPA: CAP domain-containing protein [Steroidobacteraceae bacterium]|nr:CAP domain-containing protein [Steroidobacteraceae bacterium]
MFRPLAVCLVVACFCVIAGTPATARPSLLGAINAERAAGCGGRRGVDRPLRENRKLDAVARRISRGEALRNALAAAGYRALHSSSVSLANSGSNQDIARAVSRMSCAELSDVRVHDIGVEQRGNTIWLVLAAPFEAPELQNVRATSQRVLALANEARAKPRRCGGKSFAAAPPLGLAEKLSEAAREHAQDMAKHNMLSHSGSDGSSPALRVTRARYAWRMVGENVASGPTTAEEVMQGWLESPHHCENIMDPRYTEMGVGYTVDPKSESGVYWAQVFALPR